MPLTPEVPYSLGRIATRSIRVISVNLVVINDQVTGAILTYVWGTGTQVTITFSVTIYDDDGNPIASGSQQVTVPPIVPGTGTVTVTLTPQVGVFKVARVVTTVS
ncbi:MAG: hypothetical protein RMJ30_04390 [Nitrososphaerota archaeon]|nr:hypothetical protein [Nitrososphaerota archaeon]